VWLCRVLPACAGTEPAIAGGVHEAGLVPAARAGPPVVDEVAGGYRLAGDLLPPSLPVPRSPMPEVIDVRRVNTPSRPPSLLTWAISDALADRNLSNIVMPTALTLHYP
jgi:hypothetical protein